MIPIASEHSLHQVYMERVQDLITPRHQELIIQQDANMGLYVLNATEVPVASTNEVIFSPLACHFSLHIQLHPY